MTYEPENLGYQSIQSMCTGIIYLFVKAVLSELGATEIRIRE